MKTFFPNCIGLLWLEFCGISISVLFWFEEMRDQVDIAVDLGVVPPALPQIWLRE